MMRVLLIVAGLVAAYPCVSKVGLYLLLDLRRWRERGPAVPVARCRWPGRVWLRAREIVMTYASLAHGARYRLTRARRLEAARPRAHPEHPPVLLIHGYGMSAGQLRPLGDWISATIGRDGWCLDWPSLRCDLEQAVPRFLALAEAAVAAGPPDGPGLDIVAHSLGGILVARALPQLLASGIAVRRFLAVATPFFGTEPAVCSIGPGRPWLRPTSARLARVRAELGPLVAGGLSVVCLYSIDDEMIQPATSCRLPWPGVANVALRGIGHHDLLFHPSGRERIAERMLARPGSGETGTTRVTRQDEGAM